MQIIAPIGASWATASALSDPLAAFGGAAICHSVATEADSQSDQTSHHVHDSACALCCLVAHAGASLSTPKIAIAVPYRSSLAVVWHNAAQDLRDSESGRHARARAPPSNS
ncbi:DUF2946 family protein [Bradyrhizobium barranii subsp. apii]|uniref:DUF2946 family protein n=1 Tax=Bradyrhizobium barranii subsp. apii TaxID=2819348 RepID=A0A8U0FY51_9BRAD|nr:DUF2946 family protein [Bradyrhizobium barranii]UPT91875.1 DUF2946 family protein [Bradyrhizobium barranii subsp. apii]UPU01092.1 DUF2946 family protein [Bradyrhizobium barranii subsp. apii]